MSKSIKYWHGVGFGSFARTKLYVAARSLEEAAILINQLHSTQKEIKYEVDTSWVKWRFRRTYGGWPNETLSTVQVPTVYALRLGNEIKGKCKKLLEYHEKNIL